MLSLDRATAYAEKVVIGDIPAGQPHVNACKRHLQDLERQNTEEFPYIWKPEMSERILQFGEMMTISEGTAPKPLRLLGFQHFDLGVPFGWYNRRGFRRFRRAYKSVARQNGKTMENGLKAAYISGFSGYRYGKLFTVATKYAQAKLAWEETQKFIESDPDLKELFKVQEYKSLITAIHTKCTIEALSKERGLDDGFRSIFASVDEIHQHKDNAIYKAIYNGTRSLDETLVSMITTRGRNLNSFCHEMDTYALNVLDGVTTAEDFFIDIYSLDKEDDYWEESNWIKANPYLATTEKGMESLRNDAKTARDMGGMELADFMVKCLNMWVQNTDDQFIDVSAFLECGTERTLEYFRGQSCSVGLDLSSGGDLTTVNLEFCFICNGREKTYIYSHSFIPRARLEEHIRTDLAPYDVWVNEGLITVTGGEGDYKNDYGFIIQHLRELQEKYELNFMGIGYDPHNADGFLSELESFGCPLLAITQSARFLNDATEDIRLLVKSREIEYDRKNALLVWSFVNAKIVKNSFGEIKVDKDPYARHKRIDPVDAAIDAHVLRMKNAAPPIDYDKAMDDYLKLMGWKK